MITKIKTIRNFAVFNNFSWDTSVLDKNNQPLQFKKINILYGRNYSGKTTISRIFRAIEVQQLPEKYDGPEFEVVSDNCPNILHSNIQGNSLNVRVFNEDFVRANLNFLIDQESEIVPFAILGANNTSLEKSIMALENEIGSNIEPNETGLHKDLKVAKATATDTMRKFGSASSALETKLSEKATDRRTGIKYNVDKYGDQNYNIAKIKQDIATVTNSTYKHLTAENKLECENIIREQAKPEASLLNETTLLIKDFVQLADSLVSKEIGVSNKINELLLDIALNNWVKQGAIILEGNSICAFCGNQISDQRWAEIHAHFDEESRNLETAIDELITKINSEKSSISNISKIDISKCYSKYQLKLDERVKSLNENIKQYCNSLDSIIVQLLKRKDNIVINFQFVSPDDNSSTLHQAIIDLNLILNENNKFSLELNSAKKLAQNALRLQEIADFCSTIKYSETLHQISDLEDIKNKAAKKSGEVENILNAKMLDLKSKQRQLNDEEEGARRVNKYLNDFFGHNFLTLQACKVEKDEKQIKFQIMRNGNPAYNLSEGECSLISFCYFMAKLDDIDTHGKQPIIWIDDPISSLDGNHIYFMYSLIVAKIAKTGNFEQLFISTHNLDFLKYLKRLNSYQANSNGEMKAVSKQYFFVEREGQCSKIIKMPTYLVKNATEFNYLFSLIYRCAQCNSVNDDNYDLLYSFGNSARKFLEMLLFFRYPDNAEELLPKLKRFFDSDEIPPILMDRMLNEDSHGSSPEKSFQIDIDPETIPVAKKIIQRLQLDQDQYNALLNSIGEPPVS